MVVVGIHSGLPVREVRMDYEDRLLAYHHVVRKEIDTLSRNPRMGYFAGGDRFMEDGMNPAMYESLEAFSRGVMGIPVRSQKLTGGRHGVFSPFAMGLGILLDERLSPQDRFCVLCHELTHAITLPRIFHDIGAKTMMQQSRALKSREINGLSEVVAESTAFVVATRKLTPTGRTCMMYTAGYARHSGDAERALERSVPYVHDAAKILEAVIEWGG